MVKDCFEYGGIYSPFGRAPRNQPVEIPACNPLPDNAMSNDCGDAGADGYSVLSRASRVTGERPLSGQNTPEYEGPRMSEDY